MNKLGELEKNKKSAFFYKNAHYLLPEGCKDFADFQKHFCDGKTFSTIRLFEKKCQAPYFVIENSEIQKVSITEKVYDAGVYLMSQKEYNKFLRLAVEEKCGNCPNFGTLTENDNSLDGHHEEISLEKVCYFKEMAENQYKAEYIDFSENINTFINNIVSNLSNYEKLIDSGKTKKVKDAIEEEIWQNFLEFDTTIFVGKKEDNTGYYFYYSSNMDATKALIMKVVFDKLKIMTKNTNWEINDHIPKGFFPKKAKKPKRINWKEIEFERKFYILQFDKDDSDSIENYILWLCGALGEDTFRSFCEGIEVVEHLKTDKKIETFISNIETYCQTLNTAPITFPQAVVSTRNHGDNIENVSVCTTLSSDLMEYTNSLENNPHLPTDWHKGLCLGYNYLSIFKLEFNLQEKNDFSNILQSSQNEDIDAIMNTTNYLKENLIGTLFAFELMQDKYLIYGLIFNIAKFKMAINYLKPLLSQYKAKVTIFTNSNKKGEVIYHEFNLVDQLNKYNPFDKDEKENVKKILDFLANNTNCYDRSNLKGHVTAGGLVVDGKGNVLLNHQKKTGMWFQFGGHSDGDTNCINVARREISEEAGIFDCKLISNEIFDVDVQQIDYNAKKNEPEHIHYDINFLFLVKDKNFEISNESTEIKWVTIDEAKNLISKEDKAMKRMLKKYELYCK